MAKIKRRAEESHPLIVWLGSFDPPRTLYDFIVRTKNLGISQTALYEHVRGENENPSSASLMAIESATGGDVTMREQLDWLKVKRAPV